VFVGFTRGERRKEKGGECEKKKTNMTRIHVHAHTYIYITT
jgi:hypothetical protein